MEVEADSAAVAARRRGKGRRYPRRALEFPGCRPVPLTREGLTTWEGRLEFWDAATKTAWVVRDGPDAAHEHPSQRLAALSEVIASVRGSAIECFGTVRLELRGEDGERHRIMQADQSVYLYPARARLPVGGMVVGEHDFPDVVLEVDHTTDVRRGKLWLYEEWGFPEIWVDVPDHPSPSRPASRQSGLTIHLLQDGEYRTARESRAFPGWTANEIHMALNEPIRSPITSRALDRVGRVLGARDGTEPDDTLWLQAHREQARARGRAEGRAELLDALRRRILASRGRADISDEEILDALLEMDDSPEFRARPKPRSSDPPESS